jgi:hypothetical protein
MEEQNNEVKKQSDEIISQNTDEIESLNDNEELDSESLEQIAGGLAAQEDCCPQLKSCGVH